MIASRRLFRSALLLGAGLAASAAAAEECPWKLKGFGEAIAAAEAQGAALASDVLAADAEMAEARRDHDPMFAAACDAPIRAVHDRLAVRFAELAAAGAALGTQIAPFAGCTRHFIAKVQTESAAAGAEGNAAKVLRLSAIEREIRNLEKRGNALDQSTAFLRSKLERMETVRGQMFFLCSEDGLDADF